MSNCSETLLLALAEECAILANQIENLGEAVAGAVPLTPALIAELQQVDRLSQGARATSAMLAALCCRLNTRHGMSEALAANLVSGVPLPEMRLRLTQAIQAGRTPRPRTAS